MTEMESQNIQDTTPQSPVQGTACCPATDHSLSDAELDADIQRLAAIGSETRYEILRLVATAEDGVCVCQLEPGLDVSQGAISQALARLYAANLVDRRKEGRWRYYTATPAAERLLETLDETRSIDPEQTSTNE